MMKLFAIWIFKPVMIVLWLIHLVAAYAQGQRCSMGCNPTVDRRQHPLMNAACASKRSIACGGTTATSTPATTSRSCSIKD